MANYPLTPINISTLDPLTPSDLENPAKLGEALRQTRSIIAQLLTIVMNDNGSLKTVSVLATDSVATNNLLAACVTAAKLAAGAVTTAALADAGVSTAKLIDLAISTAKIADLAITTIKLADASVATAKLIDKAVTGAKIANDAATDANRAITSDHVKDSAIIERTIASLAVSMAKLKPTASNSMLWDNGASVGSYPVDTTGDIVPTLTGGKVKFAFSSGKGNLFGAMALVVESGGAGADAGDAAVTAWNIRPAGGGSGSTDFHIIYDPAGILDPAFVVISGTPNKKRLLFVTAGKYYVKMSCAGYKVGTHAARLVDYTAGSPTVLFETGANVVAATSDVTQDFSIGEGLIIIAANNTQVQLEHYTTLAKTVNGLGIHLGVLTTNNYVYMQFVRLE